MVMERGLLREGGNATEAYLISVVSIMRKLWSE